MAATVKTTDNEYANKSNKALGKALRAELGLHMMNSTAAREKVLEAAQRLETMGDGPIPESKIVKNLRKELAIKTKKLEKIEKILAL